MSRFLSALLVFVTGCTQVPDGRFRCDVANDCPEGASCVAARCVFGDVGWDADADADAPDAQDAPDALDSSPRDADTAPPVDTAPDSCSGPELCNGVDDDCDEDTPDGADEAGVPCDENGDMCARGTTVCLAGTLMCADDDSGEDTCNGQDDDCDEAIDEGACEDCTTTSDAGRTFLICEERIDRDEHPAACEARGYSLPKFEDEDAFRAVLLEIRTPAHVRLYYATGLTRADMDDPLMWSDGSAPNILGGAVRPSLQIK